MEQFNWSEIIGHKNKINQIREMIKAKNFPNAVIFSGVAGIGKRKIAEIAAAALLCENDNVDNLPCCDCNSCRALIAGTHPDYYIVEPERSKANPMIKIDQIRSLQKEVLVMPILSDKRMVLIDDAECMNNVSQNCLLKTIEEPQGLSKFILITSNRSRLLLTLQSRCMIINFERLTEEDIKSGLINRGTENAEKIAIISNGSLGQAIGLAENDGLQIREDSLKFLENLSKLNNEEIFQTGQQLSTQPKDIFRDWTINIQKFLRDLLIVDTEIENNYYYNHDLKKRLQKLRDKLNLKNIFEMMNQTTEIQRRLNSNANLELLIESFFIRLRQAAKIK